MLIKFSRFTYVSCNHAVVFVVPVQFHVALFVFVCLR